MPGTAPGSGLRRATTPPDAATFDLRQMAIPQDLPTPVEPELLTATFSTSGEAVVRDSTWQALLGADANPWVRLSDEDQGWAAERISEAAAGSLVTNQIFPVYLPDRDEPLPVLLNFLPVHLPDVGGTRVAAITVTGEVLAEPTTWTPSQTQRHRMETLGRMTMGIAHDFNNLLSSILGHTELLKATGQQTPELAEHLRPIEQAALDGATLIRKLQQYIRQEKQTRFEPLDLPTLIHDCIALTRPYWYNEPRRKGIGIDVETDLEPIPPVTGSASELREVFINLILNAVQAMPGGGTLRFRTYDDPEHGAVAVVEDTGMGMSDDVQAHIFEPLFTTKGEHGTGMGLAVSYGVIQEHEGTIAVASEQGEGTRFTITLPPADESVVADEPTAETGARRLGRILVVDDEKLVRSVLVKMLTLIQHTVAQASSGAEALAIADTEPFDLVFTDLGMPEMNGRQLAQALRRRFPDLPIVLITGDTDTGEPDAFIDVVMSKPFQLDDLEAVIQRLLRR